MGPVGDLADCIQPLVEFFLETLRVETIVYLGTDEALEQFRAERRMAALGSMPEPDPWERTRVCLKADANAVDMHVDRERQIGELMRLQSLPKKRMAQIAMSSGQRLLACFERTALPQKAVEEAKLIVFGEAAVPTVEQVGSQFLVSPGPLNKAGVMVLDDNRRGLRLALFDRGGRQITQHHLTDDVQSQNHSQQELH